MYSLDLYEWMPNSKTVHAFRPIEIGWRSLCGVTMTNVRSYMGYQVIVEPEWSYPIDDVDQADIASRGISSVCEACKDIRRSRLDGPKLL